MLAITQELNQVQDKLASASEITERYTKKIDKALETLTPGELPYDYGDRLVQAAMEAAPFKGVGSGGAPHTKDPATYGEYLRHPNRREFRASSYEEVYQLLDKYKTLEHCSIDDVRAAREAGNTVRIVPSKKDRPSS